MPGNLNAAERLRADSAEGRDYRIIVRNLGLRLCRGEVEHRDSRSIKEKAFSFARV